MATLQKISCLSFDRRSEVTHSVLTLNRTRQVRRFLLRKRRKSISIYFLFGLCKNDWNVPSCKMNSTLVLFIPNSKINNAMKSQSYHYALVVLVHTAKKHIFLTFYWSPLVIFHFTSVMWHTYDVDRRQCSKENANPYIPPMIISTRVKGNRFWILKENKRYRRICVVIAKHSK